MILPIVSLAACAVLAIALFVYLYRRYKMDTDERRANPFLGFLRKPKGERRRPIEPRQRICVSASERNAKPQEASPQSRAWPAPAQQNRVFKARPLHEVVDLKV